MLKNKFRMWSTVHEESVVEHSQVGPVRQMGTRELMSNKTCGTRAVGTKGLGADLFIQT